MRKQLDVAPNTINVYKTKFAPSFGKHAKNAASCIKETLIKQTPDLINRFGKLDLMNDDSK